MSTSNSNDSVKAKIKKKMKGLCGANDLELTLKREMAFLRQEIASSRAALPGSGPVLLESGLEIMPGSEYARYALPLDYLPSRDYQPRWGHNRPVIKDIADFFEAHAQAYQDFLNYMQSMNVRHIALSLNEKIQPPTPAWLGGAMSPFDELALYAMVSKYKPSKFFEVGSGISTCFARQAISDSNLVTRLVSIDPEPRAEIDAICDEVYRYGLETIDITYFDQLEPGDFLYIDGSHRSFTNSDVTVFFIDILPRIKPGVIIHIHDVVLPWDYPDMFLKWYWSEQYLLAVYIMAAKERLTPLLPTAFVCRSPLFENYFSAPFIQVGVNDPAEWRGGGSFWFTKK